MGGDPFAKVVNPRMPSASGIRLDGSMTIAPATNCRLLLTRAREFSGETARRDDLLSKARSNETQITALRSTRPIGRKRVAPLRMTGPCGASRRCSKGTTRPRADQRAPDQASRHFSAAAANMRLHPDRRGISVPGSGVRTPTRKLHMETRCAIGATSTRVERADARK